MRAISRFATTLLVTLGLSAGAWAQLMQQAPQIPGEFKPVVGAGAQYEVTTKKEKATWEYAVVGKEAVEGAEGYWLEMRMEAGDEGGVVMKSLMVLRAGQPDIKRMIMQAAGQPPIEMPMGMAGGMTQRGQQAAAGEAGLGTKVGTETVTVPAGTFVCDHYRTGSGKDAADIWISTGIAPYGLVKMTSANVTIVLTKVLEDQTSKIKGQPQKFELPKF